jgi:hypothetical protein
MLNVSDRFAQVVSCSQFAEDGSKHVADRVEPAPADGDTYVGLEHLEPGSLTVRKNLWGADVDL